MPHLSYLFRLPSKLRRKARRSRMLTLLLLLLLLVTLLLPFYIIYYPPRLLIHHFQNRWPDILWEVDVPRGEKIIALTIDDAPSGVTPGILETLHDHGAKATFFVIGGQVSGREDVLVKAVQEGMELGNHAMHDEPSRSLSSAQLEEQLRDVGGMITSAYKSAGHGMLKQRYFRPGSGFFSDRVRKVVAGLGYRIVLGGVYPHDAQIGWAGVNARQILGMVRPGAIVICHDRRQWTIPMLKKVLPELRKRGYQVVTVTELLARSKGQGRDND